MEINETSEIVIKATNTKLKKKYCKTNKNKNLKNKTCITNKS